MPPAISLLAQASILAIIITLIGCAPSPKPPVQAITPTIATPDQGIIILASPDGSVKSESLPALFPTTLRPATTASDPPLIPFAVTGPDAQGRVAILDSALQGHGHTLSILAHGSSPQILFTHNGDPIRDHAVGRSLAMSHTTGKIAFVSGIEELRPGIRLSQGALEVWDAASATRILPPPQAVQDSDIESLPTDDQAPPATRPARPPGATIVFDSGLTWFPDGQRLAIVQSVLTAPIPNGGLAPDGFGAAFAGWQDVPAVYILDTVTGNQRFLSIGIHPVLSPDGQSMYVSDLRWIRPTGPPGVRWRKIDLGNFQATPVDLPSQGDVLAALPGERFFVLTVPFGTIFEPGKRPALSLEIQSGDVTQLLHESLEPDMLVGFSSTGR